MAIALNFSEHKIPLDELKDKLELAFSQAEINRSKDVLGEEYILMEQDKEFIEKHLAMEMNN